MAANVATLLPTPTPTPREKLFPPRKQLPLLKGGANVSKKRDTSLPVRRDVSKKRRTTGKHAQEGKRDLKHTMRHDIDPSSYRNSIFHNICTEMLEKGFHESFSELYVLVEQQRKDHANAGPGDILLEPLIEHNITKLEYLKVQLTMAEDAYRVGDLDTVYMAQRKLAQYFEQTEDAKRTKDRWLSDHFYSRCLETGSMVKGDNRRKEGEAHCHVGLALENRGAIMKASLHLETFYQLARQQNWHTESGESVHVISCEHLRRVYTTIAEEVHSADQKSAISYLKKAHEVAKEGGDTYQEGKACYRLGNAYEGIGDSDAAIMYHKQFLECCKFHGDDAGEGKAYKVLAKSYESKGDSKTAVKFLETYVAVAEKANLIDSLAEACSAIGIMHNSMGDYEKAVDYFKRCYGISSGLNNPAALHSARVQYGIARGHQLMGDFSGLLVGLPGTMSSLVTWKDARVNPYEENEDETEDEDEDEEEEEEDEEEEEEEEEDGDEEVSDIEDDNNEQKREEERKLELEDKFEEREKEMGKTFAIDVNSSEVTKTQSSDDETLPASSSSSS